MINDWLDFALKAVVGATAFLCLFDGTRRIGIHGLHRMAVVMTALAAAFYVLYASFAYWKYQDLTDTLITHQRSLVPTQPAKDAGKGLSPERREAANLAPVHQAFAESGTLGTYLDRNGRKKLFVPSQSDIRKREQWVAAYTKLDYAARSSFSEALLWLITGLLAALFGYAFSRERIPVPASPAAAGDASRSETRPAA